MIEILRNDTINEAFIVFAGQKARIKCDRKCDKAWGINSRPRQQIDEESYCFMADDELGVAPETPGTYECADAKPLTPDEFPNKWCVRECERCAMSNPGEWDKELELKQLDKKTWKTNL